MSNLVTPPRGPARAVLVTGATSGIGLATALRLAERGDRVFAGVRTPAQVPALQREHPRLTPLVLDVRDEASRAAAIANLSDALAGQPLTGLVNNAGIAVQGPLEVVPLAELVHQFEVNLFGLAGLVQRALPLLRAASRAGHRVTIVNVGSIGGRLPIPFNGPYNASKFALVGYTGSLRQELRPWGIRVALVEPGTTRTAIWTKVEQSVDRSQGPGGGLYHAMLDRYRDSVRALQRGGIPAGRVAAVIDGLLRARWPAHRSLVGDARLLALLTWLPTVARDALMARALGLPGRAALLAEVAR